jgi:hypothetical protein
VAAFLVTFGVGAGIGAAASGSSTNTTTTGAEPAATVTVTAAAAGSSPRTTAPKTPAPTSAGPATGPKTVLTAKGTGTKNTARFTTGNDWTIHWSYDCSKTFGGQGNFIVDVYDGSEPSFTADGVNELGKKGADKSPVYDDAGPHYLSVDSECPWQLTVTEP